MNMTKKRANEITGGLSKPGKMPEGAYSLPAAACKVGSILAEIPGTVCHGCYALKGMYRFPVVKDAMARRLASLRHPDWVQAMVTLITGKRHFRWHDSGDLQGPGHWSKVKRVARRTPGTVHWMPTKEHRVVKAGEANIPDNLVVRHSVTQVNGSIPVGARPRDLWSAAWDQEAIDDRLPPGAHLCPANQQDGKCVDCRACWDGQVKLVIYPMH